MYSKVIVQAADTKTFVVKIRCVRQRQRAQCIHHAMK